MIRKGSRVQWTWAGSTAGGKVVERFTDRVERTLGGSHIVRNASRDNPAYLIRQDDGAEVLKAKSELQRVRS